MDTLSAPRTWNTVSGDPLGSISLARVSRSALGVAMRKLIIIRPALNVAAIARSITTPSEEMAVALLILMVDLGRMVE